MPTKSVDVEILKTEKLNGHNYDDWHKDLKIPLEGIPLEGVLYIEDTISERPSHLHGNSIIQLPVTLFYLLCIMS